MSRFYFVGHSGSVRKVFPNPVLKIVLANEVKQSRISALSWNCHALFRCPQWHVYQQVERVIAGFGALYPL